ncbi:MAG: winged helix DNA-binding domain-containing protein, partial [Gemmatimonadales bacterium]
MARLDLLSQRLYHQHITGAPLETPGDVVRWLGGVQSQDYPGAKWSLGQRARDASDSEVDQAFARGEILRTHVLRPTWHFVAPADIRWMLELTAPHVHALNAYSYRKCELDQAVLGRSQAVLARALEGGRQLTRPELATALRQAGIVAQGQRLAYIMMKAELDGLVCSGALRGKQHTYALLEERVPRSRARSRDEALAELALRFFTGHAPATLQHFGWWSGLSAKAARAGLAMIQQQLPSRLLDGTQWFGLSERAPRRGPPTAHLLPEYDEALVGYRDLGVSDMPRARRRKPRKGGFHRPVIIGGKRAGTWRRTIARGTA